MPARLRAIMRACSALGIRVVPASRHYKAERDGARCYTIPAHNGERTEIPDWYISGLCRNFGIDEDEFRALL